MKKYIQKFLDTPWQRTCVYLLLAFMAAWFHNLENQDELWNYTFANNIANGLLPYRDFNLLQTPFSCLVNAIFILIFGHHLVVIRMTGAVLFTMIATKADKVSRQLGAKGIYEMFIPVIFLCMFFWNVFLEYSCLILFFELCLISFDLEIVGGEKKSMGQIILSGVLMGCAMMSKQTFGTFVAVASWISILVVSDKKLKSLFFRMLGTSIPCFIFLFYLLGTGTFGDFWDMAFLGIQTFSSSYSYISFMKENPAYFFLGALLPIMLIWAVVWMIRQRKTKNALVILTVMIYAVFGCINMYPMANAYHVMICSIPILLLMFTLLPEKVWNWLFSKIVGYATVAGIGVFLIFINSIDDAIHYDLTTDIEGLECTFMTEEEHEEITLIDAYIREQNEEGTTVYILDNFAALYFIPSNQYHKYLDMFLVGNLGTKTPEECLAEADETSVFLMPDSSRGQFQYPYDAIREFKEGLTEGETLGEFTVYSYAK